MGNLTDCEIILKGFLASKLGELRVARKMTATQCAAILDCSIAAWSQYEKGKRDPGLESIPAICKMFDINSDELFGIECGTPPTPVQSHCTPGSAPICAKCPYKKKVSTFEKILAK